VPRRLILGQIPQVVNSHQVKNPLPLSGAGAGLFTATDGADMGRVDDEPLEVNLVRPTKVGQQDLVDLAPDARGLPVAQAVPTGHAAATAHLLRQILPGQAGLEDEDDPSKDFAIVKEGASPFGLRGMRRDQRSNPFPEFVCKHELGHGEPLLSRTTVSWTPLNTLCN
jgi:hypothetical protein